jgi:hypothetical protein
MSLQPHCVECGLELTGSHIHRMYCSRHCKTLWRKKHGPPKGVKSHVCRICGTEFSITSGQYNKWLCSAKCIRASNAKSIREFHTRRPAQQEIYYARTKAKLPPDSMNRRFYRVNPTAPRSCQSCGEDRVVEVAHKPGYERLGERRSVANMKWPELVWILCPTCHRLLDRMHYGLHDLGLDLTL